MLLPEAGGHGQEGQLIDVGGFRREEGGGAAQEAEPLSGKKPSSVQETTSMVSFRQVQASYSRSGMPQEP